MLSAVNVNVEFCPEEIEGGLKDAVTPAGRPVVESWRLSAAPLVIAVETLKFTELPPCIGEEDGVALIEKSSALTNVRTKPVEC